MRSFLLHLLASGMVLLGAKSVSAQPIPPATNVYEAAKRLNLDLPFEGLSYGDIRRALEILMREPCDQVAIQDLGTALDRRGFRRDAAAGYEAFSDSCGGYPRGLRAAVNLLLKLSDNSTAIRVATRLIALEPFNDNGYFLRGLARLDAGDAKGAIDDFTSALELFGDKSRISSVSYEKMAKAYELLGQYCDGIIPLEAWVALNPGRNDTSQVQAMIRALAAKGDCRPIDGKEDVIPIARRGQVVAVQATVNGSKGLFIFDTGATFVSLKRSFAQKAKVDIDEQSAITLRTANGQASAKRGRAGVIQLKTLKANDVAVVVQADLSGGYGDVYDGLLGMSFLQHFTISMDGSSIRFRPRTGR